MFMVVSIIHLELINLYKSYHYHFKMITFNNHSNIIKTSYLPKGEIRIVSVFMFVTDGRIPLVNNAV